MKVLQAAGGHLLPLGQNSLKTGITLQTLAGMRQCYPLVFIPRE